MWTDDKIQKGVKNFFLAHIQEELQIPVGIREPNLKNSHTQPP